MRVIFAFIFILLFGACTKEYNLVDLAADAAAVKACLGVTTDLPDATLSIVDGDKVIIDGEEYCGYYTPNRITLPKNKDGKVNINCIRHEMIHHVVYHTTSLGTDPNHHATVNGQNAYLKCGGLLNE